MFVVQANKDTLLQRKGGESGAGGQVLIESHQRGHALTGWSASSSAP